MFTQGAPDALWRAGTWKPFPQGWDVHKINRLLAAARAAPGRIASAPAGVWWTAFLLAVLDTGESADTLLMLPVSALDAQAGTLRCRLLTYRLHPPTLAALAELAQFRMLSADLFPRDFDRNGKSFKSMIARLRIIAARSGLRRNVAQCMRMLRCIALRVPDILELIDLDITIDLPPEAAFHKPRRNQWTARPDVYALAIPGDRCLLPFFEDVYRPLRLSRASLKTLQKIRATLNTLRDYAGCEPHFGLLTDETVQRWMIWNAERPNRSPVTANGHARNVLALWRFAWKKRKVAELPRDVMFLPVLHREPEAWSVQEMQRLIKAASAESEMICGVPAPLWWRALLLTLFYTGVRIRAALAVRWDAFNPQTGVLAVRAETQKDKAEQRFILPADCRAAIEAVRTVQPLIFPRPWAEHWLQPIYDRLVRLLTRAGLPTTHRDKFHRIRRTTGTLICDASDEETACKYLGHSSVSVTRRYLDKTKIRREQTTDLLPRLDAQDIA